MAVLVWHVTWSENIIELVKAVRLSRDRKSKRSINQYHLSQNISSAVRIQQVSPRQRDVNMAKEKMSQHDRKQGSFIVWQVEYNKGSGHQSPPALVFTQGKRFTHRKLSRWTSACEITHAEHRSLAIKLFQSSNFTCPQFLPSKTNFTRPTDGWMGW